MSMGYRFLMLVLDGAADDPSSRPTPLEAARTPGLDQLASHAICGLHYPVGPGIAPESDAAVMALLGYEPERYYTGRGPLEALGAGIRIIEGREVAFRANFATIDEETLDIIDRRVGRSLTSGEAKELAKAVDGLELGGGEGYARVKATIGHRAVVVIGHHRERLSGMVSNTDPAYERKGLISVAVRNPPKRIGRCRPLVDDEAALRTCQLVNEFTEKAIRILREHPVNIERARKGLPKANAILLRDAGDKLPRLPRIAELHGFASAAAIVEMPVEKGIALAAGLKPYEVPEPSGKPEEDIPTRLDAALRALKENEFVYVHLKGPDEPGHDGDFERKKKSIELIDTYFIRPLIKTIDLDKTIVIVTSDHATPWRHRAHSGDPVPVMVSWAKLRESVGSFSEASCAENSALGTIDYGWLLLPRIIEFIKKRI